MCSSLQPITGSHRPTSSKEDGGTPSSKSGLFVEEGADTEWADNSHPPACRLLPCPAPLTWSWSGRPGETCCSCGDPRSLDCELQRRLLGRFPAGWMAVPPSAVLSPGLLSLEMALLARACSGPILKASRLTAVPWGPCWWINLAGGASFTHLLLAGAACILAP